MASLGKRASLRPSGFPVAPVGPWDAVHFVIGSSYYAVVKRFRKKERMTFLTYSIVNN